MTHEYVIATGGLVLTGHQLTAPNAGPATAIAWAADRVLAVGPDAEVRAISRGDSTFLDLDGCLVTAAPSDLARAESLAPREGDDVLDALVAAGLLPADDILEPGSPADLAFWGPDGRIRAVVRDGAFTIGDVHAGPFARIGS